MCSKKLGRGEDERKGGEEEERGGKIRRLYIWPKTDEGRRRRRGGGRREMEQGQG